MTAYIENTQLRKENQAILQTLETGVIKVDEDGIKYFNNEGEKTLVRAIYYSESTDELKQKSMMELRRVSKHSQHNKFMVSDD